MKNRIAILSTLILIIAILLTGCWSKREIEDLAIVAAIGIDYLPAQEHYRLSVQIDKPGVVRGPQGGTEASGDKSTPSPVLVLSGEGRTLLDANRKLQQQLARDLFWAHSMVVVIGEEAAKEGIGKLDFLVRDRQTRLNQYIFVTKGKAEDILQLPPDLETIPANMIEGIVEQGIGISLELREFYAMMLAKGDNPVAALIRGRNEERYEPGGTPREQDLIDVSGTAIFRGERLVGYFDSYESRGLMWLRNKVETGIITIPCPSHTEEELSFLLRRAKSKTKAEVSEAGEISFTIAMELEVDLDEQTCSDDLTKPENISLAERAVEDDIRRRAGIALTKAQQEFKSDVFGLGEALHRSHPQIWRQVREEWNDYFTAVPVTIEVKALLRRTGMVGKPLRGN